MTTSDISSHREGATRLMHFSDIHLSAPRLGWNWRDLFTKRTAGWFNLKMGRGRRFRYGPEILDALRQALEREHYDHLIFSGDASMLGFESEFALAAAAMGVGDPMAPPGLAVPGNHDYYLWRCVKAGGFERHFAPWQQGKRLESATYPFAQAVGNLWLIGVNSARPNRFSWDARGQVGKQQLARLEELLADLGPGRRILVTHYPIHLDGGRLERPWRRLRDWQALRAIAIQGKVEFWLHGHRHGNYLCEPTTETPFYTICAGSATQLHRWSYNDYTFTHDRLLIRRRVYNPEQRRFDEANAAMIELRPAT